MALFRSSPLISAMPCRSWDSNDSATKGFCRGFGIEMVFMNASRETASDSSCCMMPRVDSKVRPSPTV